MRASPRSEQVDTGQAAERLRDSFRVGAVAEEQGGSGVHRVGVGVGVRVGVGVGVSGWLSV